MTVKELIKELEKIPKDYDVILEENINGVEYNCEIETVYVSGNNVYLYGAGEFEEG